jgi:5-methylcytosine-specific restriction enzyme subunit McrC
MAFFHITSDQFWLLCYHNVDELIESGARGKLDFATSLKANLFPMGRAACVFEQLTHDVLHNRILKRTVANLLKTAELDPKLAEPLGTCLARLTEVSDVHLDSTIFARVQLHSNNGFYDFILRICRLIFDASVVDERTGQLRFRDFEREQAMASLYEKFLLRFYRREQSSFRKVSSESFPWQATGGALRDLEVLPSMRTDVSLESRDRKIVIDAKYHREPLQSSFGKDSVRSGHLYQLWAYLKNLECLGGVNVNAEGILLYPRIDAPFDLRYRIHGHFVRVATIDLIQDWRGIHEFLLNLIAPQFVSPSGAIQDAPNCVV